MATRVQTLGKSLPQLSIISRKSPVQGERCPAPGVGVSNKTIENCLIASLSISIPITAPVHVPALLVRSNALVHNLVDLSVDEKTITAVFDANDVPILSRQASIVPEEESDEDDSVPETPFGLNRTLTINDDYNGPRQKMTFPISSDRCCDVWVPEVPKLVDGLVLHCYSCNRDFVVKEEPPHRSSSTEIWEDGRCARQVRLMEEGACLQCGGV